ncbi:hypothetical protein [Iamia sp. SCSIO 61187]|uniref:hypothetical protein n=1 Tax=Iamia sp. SCSIO 61187 TaxID=2722752 RepID=UPI001C637957|nr:hypothetical protein [Iamia sp. SCSIO 61187]
MTCPERFGSDSLERSFLRSRATTTEGGTSEVMRNILGERVLGLPLEPRIDRDLPLTRRAPILTAVPRPHVTTNPEEHTMSVPTPEAADPEAPR